MKKLTTLITLISLITGAGASGEIMYNVQENMIESTVVSVDESEIKVLDNEGIQHTLDMSIRKGDKMYLHVNDEGNIDSANVVLNTDEKEQTVEEMLCGLYPKTGVVTLVDYDTNQVHIMDVNKNVWVLEDTDDWETGDVASLIMDGKETFYTYDDEIVSAKYAGTLEMLKPY